MRTACQIAKGWQFDRGEKRNHLLKRTLSNKCEDSNKTDETQQEQKFSDPFLAEMRIN